VPFIEIPSQLFPWDAAGQALTGYHISMAMEAIHTETMIARNK
jgi:hypothetical protein